MRILFIAHDFYAAGAQYSLLRLLSCLRRKTDWNMGVLALADGVLRKEYAELVPVRVADENLQLRRCTAAEAGRAVRAALRALAADMGGPPDCVLGNTILASLVWPALKTLNVPLLLRVAELPTAFSWYSSFEMQEIMLRHTAHYVAVSEPVRAMLVQLGVPAQNISILPGGIASGSAAREDRDSAWVDSVGLPPDVPVLWGCGTVSERKGTDLFFEACRCLADLGQHDFHAVWAGGRESAPFSWAGALPGQHPADARIYLAGVLDKPYLLMRPGDIFVLSSREDPFPLAALEAAERGLPIVGFEGAGGMEEVIRAGAGLLARREDPLDMAEKLAALLGDPAGLKARGETARQITLSRYTLEQIGPRWIDLFERQAGGGVSRPRPSRRASRPKLKVVVRNAGERTNALCVKLLEGSVRPENIAVIEERDFGKALRACFVEGLRLGAQWTLAIDADVLVAPGFVTQAVKTAESLRNFFALQGLVLDKFFQALRPAGHYLYKTECLEQAARLIPSTGSGPRLEADVVSAMLARGHSLHQTPLLVGLHDFEQEYADIAGKCFLQAAEYKACLPLVTPLWREREAGDADFKIALAAVADGLSYDGAALDEDLLRARTEVLLLRCAVPAAKKPLATERHTGGSIVKILKEGLREALHSHLQQAVFSIANWSREHTR